MVFWSPTLLNRCYGLTSTVPALFFCVAPALSASPSHSHWFYFLVSSLLFGSSDTTAASSILLLAPFFFPHSIRIHFLPRVLLPRFLYLHTLHSLFLCTSPVLQLLGFSSLVIPLLSPLRMAAMTLREGRVPAASTTADCNMTSPLTPSMNRRIIE